MLSTLPQLFYENPAYQKLLVDGSSCVVYKKVSAPVWQKEGYVSAHAITLVLKGNLRVETAEGMYAEVPENKMVFLPKGIYMISDILPEDSCFEAMVFFFDESIITEYINSINLSCSKEKCISHLLLDYTPEIQVFTESLRQLYGGNIQAPRELTRMKLFEFLHLIRASSQGECFTNALASLNNRERKSLSTFMQENYLKPLSIEDYAYLTGRSVSKFYRDFKSQFQIAPKQWLIDKRLEKAYQLLSFKSQSPISSIATEVGYENIPHFIKQFRKKYGITPKQLLIEKRKAILI